MTGRALWRALLGLVLGTAGWLGAAPADPDLSPAESLLARGTAWRDSGATVERGLAYLKRQVKDSGAVGSRYTVAVTSLAGLAILGAGQQPGQEPYGPMLKSCLNYLLASSDNGFFTEPGESESRMHGHCYAVLFLCEVLGSLEPEDEERVATAIKKAVQVIEKAQSREGGWFYWAQNQSSQDEASVTVCALQALRAARNVGFVVDAQRIDQAIRYVKRCQNPRGDGSFAYSLAEPQRTTYALSVAAISTLNAAGVYESHELKKGLDFVRKALDAASTPWKAAEEEYSHYANLYAAQALYQDGGALWARWYPAVRDHLITKQRSDGSWDSRFGSEYATAAAVLILEVPLGYLPIFQR
jgi:prenyltransferase beta subunit